MLQDVSFYLTEDCQFYISKYKDLNQEIVVSAYIVDDKKICLIDHSDLKNWLPPGGHIKVNEAPIDAVKREVYEETGCRVEISSIERFYAENHTIFQVPPPRFVQHELIKEDGKKPHIHVNLVYFCKVISKGNDIQTYEGSVKWFEMNELDTIDRLYPHTKMNAFAAIREIGNIIPDSLIIEKNRVLVPIGGRCPFKCTYCYTKRHDVYFGEPNPKRTVLKLEELLKQNEGNDSLTAQLGYDNDPFLDPDVGFEFIYRMLWLPIHIGFSTKAYLSVEYAERLAKFRQIKNEQGFNISGLVTLTCIRNDTVMRLEPRSPKPEKRLQTVKNLSDYGIPVMINLRPIISTIVSEEELFEVIRSAKTVGACGIVIGAFWTDPEGIVVNGLFNNTEFGDNSNKRIEWSPHGMNWTRYEDSNLLTRLFEFCKSIDIKAFDSSAEAVKWLNAKMM